MQELGLEGFHHATERYHDFVYDHMPALPRPRRYRQRAASEPRRDDDYDDRGSVTVRERDRDRDGRRDDYESVTVRERDRDRDRDRRRDDYESVTVKERERDRNGRRDDYESVTVKERDRDRDDDDRDYRDSRASNYGSRSKYAPSRASQAPSRGDDDGRDRENAPYSRGYARPGKDGPQVCLYLPNYLCLPFSTLQSPSFILPPHANILPSL